MRISPNINTNLSFALPRDIPGSFVTRSKERPKYFLACEMDGRAQERERWSLGMKVMTDPPKDVRNRNR
jgi:hypothetical protein